MLIIGIVTGVIAMMAVIYAIFCLMRDHNNNNNEWLLTNPLEEKEEENITQSSEELSDNILELEKTVIENDGFLFSPEHLIFLREERKGFTGIYIIYNSTKEMYYVGQAQNVYQRSSNHFLGKGNADIYADYKYGDEFRIKLISLIDSGYDNLDDLERYYIDKYDSIRNGYNKKKGNK